MASTEETLRLQFGTASNAIGGQLYTTEKINDGNPGLHRNGGKPRVIGFEAKDRILREVSATQAIHHDRVQQDLPSAWDGDIQIYNHGTTIPLTQAPRSAYWNWDHFSDKNLFEVEEFRPFMPLHNVFEGQSTCVSLSTMDSMEDRLRSVLEECDNLRLVENFVDMDSSWAGLSLEVLTYLGDECPGTVVATYGNDWSYPLADQNDANLYSAGIESRDKSKIQARRHINLLASVAMLIESSTVFLPVALTQTSRQYSIESGESELHSAATYAASAIDIAMSEFRATSTATVYNLLEGIIPTTKILELSARFPLTESPVTLIDDATALSTLEHDQWAQHSLLPQYTLPRSRGVFGSSMSSTTLLPPPRFRRVHFRGEFDSHASLLESALARFAPENMVATWTQEPLYVETAHTMNALDTASQLSLSHAVGTYLYGLATQTSRSDRRILYEFTQAGMNVDAIEEFQATLRGMSETYPTFRHCQNSDDSNNEE